MYIVRFIAIPSILQNPAIINWPSIKPQKNGLALSRILNPPERNIMYFNSQLIKMEDQQTFIEKLLDMAYPAG